MGEVPFLGSFMGLAAIYALALVVLMLTQLPPASRTHGEGIALPLGKILRQPGFIVAVSAAMVGYGVMNLAMTATPLAMEGPGITLTTYQ